MCAEFLNELWREVEAVAGAKRTWVLELDDDVDDQIMFSDD